jgi:excisionase family DNA binding protein
MRPATQPESGLRPDILAIQRSRADESSAAHTPNLQHTLASTNNASTALDAAERAPLPQALPITNATRCQLLTARVVAETLNVCVETVLRWIRNGELPAIRLPGGAPVLSDTLGGDGGGGQRHGAW